MHRSVIRSCVAGALVLVLAPSPAPAQSVPATSSQAPRTEQKQTLTPAERADPATATPRTDKLDVVPAPPPPSADRATAPDDSPGHELTPPPEESASPATVTPDDSIASPEDASKQDKTWPPGSVPVTVRDMPGPLEPAPSSAIERRTDKLDVKPLPPPPPPDPAQEQRDLIIVIVLFIVFAIGSLAWRIYLWRSVPHFWAKWWLSPWLTFWSDILRKRRKRNSDARLSAFAPFLLPLLLAQGPELVSYKFTKPKGDPGGYSYIVPWNGSPDAREPFVPWLSRGEQATAGGLSTHRKAEPQAGANGIVTGPKVTLKLVDPAHPALILINETGLVAKDVEYAVALWKAETLEELYANDGSGPATLDPRAAFGPLDLFDRVKIGRSVKPGDKIVGNIAVNCRICARGYSYWVYIDWGKSGWVAEIAGNDDGALVVPKGLGAMPPGVSPQWSRTELLKHTLVSWVASVPPQARTPIAKLTLPEGVRLVSPE